LLCCENAEKGEKRTSKRAMRQRDPGRQFLRVFVMDGRAKRNASTGEVWEKGV
jgi:hypothetical protein